MFPAYPADKSPLCNSLFVVNNNSFGIINHPIPSLPYPYAEVNIFWSVKDIFVKQTDFFNDRLPNKLTCPNHIIYFSYTIMVPVTHLLLA